MKPSTAAVGLLAAVAAGIGIAALFRKKDTEHLAAGDAEPDFPADEPPPPAPPPPPPPAGMPKPGVPILIPVPNPKAILGLSGPSESFVPDFADPRLQGANKPFLNVWPRYAIVMYRAPMISENAYGEYLAPIVFAGHVRSRSADGVEVVSPDDEMVAYLAERAAEGSPLPGWWAAHYAMVSRSSDGSGRVTGYGALGPWMTGRYGKLTGLNEAFNVAWLPSFLRLPTSAAVTQYVLLDKSHPVPAEVPLAN